MPKVKFNLPENWKVSVEEVSPYQFRVVGTATDGRKIEKTGSDDVKLLREVHTSIEEFETLAKYRTNEPES